MARWLDLMLCIFPFEADLYRQSGLRAIFVGHPMIENLEAKRLNTSRDPDLVGIFPGSREREVRKLMPVLIQVMRELRARKHELRFEIAAASEALAPTIRAEIEGAGNSLGEVDLVVDAAAGTMQRSAVGVIASGTATLEAAFFRLPFVLVYKVAWLTYLAARFLVQVKHLGMPNVLAGREIIPEFIQEKAEPVRIADAVVRLLDEPARRAQMNGDFDSVMAKLGTGGANETAARAIFNAISAK
jgi:lipid-A-disaccharide synthase